PRALSAALMRALAKEPGRRFQSALEFRAALRDTGHGEAAPPPAPSVAAVRNPELAEMESRLSRTLGPIASRLVATASRRYATISEIRQALAAEIEDPKERAAFLKAGSGVKTDPGVSTATIDVRPPTAPAVFDPVVLDRVAQALAAHIGPIAKIVVARAARSARSAEELQSALATEISSETDRQRFLAAIRPMF